MRQRNRKIKKIKRTNKRSNKRTNKRTNKRSNKKTNKRERARVKSVKIGSVKSKEGPTESRFSSGNLKEINETIHITTLRKGVILYRTQPVSCKKIKPMNCEDTGKMGIYFSKNKYTPLGMILEYNKPMYLCKYKIKKDIKLYNGKYIFRSLEPERYYQTIEDWRKGKFILNINPQESINHIQGGVKGAEEYLIPIHSIFDKFNTVKGEKLWEKEDEVEVFINDPKLVECISQNKFSISEAEKEIKELISKIK